MKLVSNEDVKAVLQIKHNNLNGNFLLKKKFPLCFSCVWMNSNKIWTMNRNFYWGWSWLWSLCTVTVNFLLHIWVIISIFVNLTWNCNYSDHGIWWKQSTAFHVIIYIIWIRWFSTLQKVLINNFFFCTVLHTYLSIRVYVLSCFDRNAGYFILLLIGVLSLRQNLALGFLHKMSYTGAWTFCSFRMFSISVGVSWWQ